VSCSGALSVSMLESPKQPHGSQGPANTPSEPADKCDCVRVFKKTQLPLTSGSPCVNRSNHARRDAQTHMRDMCRYRGGSVFLQLVGQLGIGVNKRGARAAKEWVSQTHAAHTARLLWMKSRKH
jgi:hypothetical protein